MHSGLKRQSLFPSSPSFLIKGPGNHNGYVTNIMWSLNQFHYDTQTLALTREGASCKLVQYRSCKAFPKFFVKETSISTLFNLPQNGYPQGKIFNTNEILLLQLLLFYLSFKDNLSFQATVCFLFHSNLKCNASSKQLNSGSYKEWKPFTLNCSIYTVKRF